MPLLLETAELLSQEQMERGVIEEIIDRDFMFALLPFVGVNGKAYVYDREKTEAPVSWASPNMVVQEGGMEAEEVTARLKILIGDVDVDKFLQGTMSDKNDQTAVQIAGKAKALRRAFQRCLATGDVTQNNLMFDGIARLASPEYTIQAGANGAAISFSMLDQLKDAVILGADCFVMRSGTWRAIKALMRAANGNTADLIQMPNFGMPVPHFDGVPIVINDFLSNTEVMGTNAATCSIYAARFNEADGLHGIYGGGTAGFVVENIGTVQNKDANRIRLKWYTSLVLKSTRSLARVQGVTSI